ncbi:MAG TPA: MbtH family NRPS accessory protein [Anaerolineales bacterium]|nr:MbtH family NRPS accessory protein [Anaerolineales bacterium]
MPNNPFEEENETFVVVVNDEGQYSIWPESREIPAGFKSTGKTGKKKECLDHIEETWTDMRPKSLRSKIKQQAEDGE